MASKTMKRYPTSLVFREMQMKTMRYHFTSIKMATILKKEKRKESKRWQECGETGTLVHFWWEYKMMELLWKTVWQLLKKLHTDDPAFHS